MDAVRAEVLREIDIKARVRSDRIRGQIGYPPQAAISEKIERRIDEEVARSIPLLRPAGMYRIFKVESSGRRSVALEGGVTFRGAIGEFLGKVDRVALFIATAGAEIYREAQEELRAGRALEGLVANAVGSEAAECATEELEDRIRAAAAAESRAITLRYSPGYCGMDIREQGKIFSTLDGSEIGVELLPTFIMKPVKSVSGLIGIGAPEEIVASGSPCGRCDRTDCMMRRYA